MAGALTRGSHRVRGIAGPAPGWRRGWPSGTLKMAPVCGTILASFFAIANLAAMEGVQRQMVSLIRKP